MACEMTSENGSNTSYLVKRATPALRLKTIDYSLKLFYIAIMPASPGGIYRSVLAISMSFILVILVGLERGFGSKFSMFWLKMLTTNTLPSMQLSCVPINTVRVQKKTPDDTCDTQAIGRSKGGLSTKIHAICDALGNPTGFHLTPGQAHDLQGADVLLDAIYEIGALLADKAYDAAKRVLEHLKEANCKAVIPPKSNRKEQREYDKEMLSGGISSKISSRNSSNTGLLQPATIKRLAIF